MASKDSKNIIEIKKHAGHNLALFLKNLIKDKNITAEEIAESINLSERSIRNYIDGTSFPDTSSLLILRKECGLDINSLIDSINDNEDDYYSKNKIFKEISIDSEELQNSDIYFKQTLQNEEK